MRGVMLPKKHEAGVRLYVCMHACDVEHGGRITRNAVLWLAFANFMWQYVARAALRTQKFQYHGSFA